MVGRSKLDGGQVKVRWWAARARAIFTFLTIDVGRPRLPGSDHASVTLCQSSEIATLLISLCFVFKIWFLSIYCVKYYDYIVVKWCRGIYCNWCVSLDIANILALT